MYKRDYSKKSLPILKFDNKLICSQVDPVREAQKWLSHQEIGNVKSLIVLGVGSGYHLKELCHANPQRNILAIDLHREPLEFFKKEHGSYSQLRFYHYRNLTELSLRSHVIEVLKDSYKVLTFHPVVLHEVDSYQLISDFLLGRSEQGFINICRIRKEFGHFVNLNNEKRPTLRSIDSQHLVTMSHLKKWMIDSLDTADWKHRFLMNAIGELIA